MIDYLEIIRNIEILKNYIKIDEIKMGNSERLKIKVTTKNKQYFVKIVKNALDEDYINNITWLYNQYEKLHIYFGKLIEIYVLADKNISVLVFEYIEGKPLSLLGKEKLDYEKYGIIVANYSLRLKNISMKNRIVIDIEQFTREYIEKIEKLKEDLKKLNLTNQKTIDLIKEKLLEIANKIKLDPPHYIHGDIKTDNFIIDKNGQLWITDIDYILPSYYCFDTRWIILKSLLPEEQNEKYFLKGFLKTIYKNERIDKFEDEMIYIMLINLISSSEEYIEDKNKLIRYYRYINNILENKNHYIYKLLIDF